MTRGELFKPASALKALRDCELCLDLSVRDLRNAVLELAEALVASPQSRQVVLPDGDMLNVRTVTSVTFVECGDASRVAIKYISSSGEKTFHLTHPNEDAVAERDQIIQIVKDVFG